MSEIKLDAKPRPHAARGERLRARKEQLIAQGKLPNDLKKIAKMCGDVSVSAFGMWERGETWPRDHRRAALAAAMQWTEQELDHGPQSEPGNRGDNGEMSSHPVSPDELELLALYRGLEDEKADVRRYLTMRLHARQTIGKNLRGPIRTASDTEVESKMPVTDPKRNKKMPGKKRGTRADE